MNSWTWKFPNQPAPILGVVNSLLRKISLFYPIPPILFVVEIDWKDNLGGTAYGISGGCGCK